MIAPDRPRRSALYLPASNARALEKARALPCDVVILDLEDAVGPDDKAAARRAAAQAVRAGGFGSRELAVRVNALDTPWGRDDVAAMAQAGAEAVLAPKVSAPADLAALAAAAPGARIWAMIESCQAILSLDALGRASRQHRVDVWIMGLNDLAKEMRCRQTTQRETLAPAMVLAVAAARANGLCILDGVFNDIGDETGLAWQCRQGADFGFDGKTLIHPSQIAASHAAFSPTEDEVGWARTVVRAFESPENAGKGVLKVEGRMVERLHLAQAERLLAVAAAIAGREGERCA